MSAHSPNPETERFAFGQNWQHFVANHLTSRRIEDAQQKLLKFLGRDDLQGSTFLDIGCGSGLHSLAAWKSNALRVVSFDFDPDSVAATEQLRNAVGAPSNWTVIQGSVLDQPFLDALGTSDIVYSWGVLHHTGSMWQAIKNAASLMEKNGLFYIALYTSDLFIDRTPAYWLSVKQRYNQSNSIIRLGWEIWYALRFDMLPQLIRLKNPFQKWLDYRRQRRGMAYWTDIRDWLGGWPMEFAGIHETLTYCETQLNLELVNLKTGESCSEYLFCRQGSVNDWDRRLGPQKEVALSGPFPCEQGWLYSIDLSETILREMLGADFPGHWTLLEDGRPIGLGRCPKDHVQRVGLGRFGTEGHRLFFAASDNSDPNLNRRKYSLVRFHQDGMTATTNDEASGLPIQSTNSKQ